jgi:hypothetical protein
MIIVSKMQPQCNFLADGRNCQDSEGDNNNVLVRTQKNSRDGRPTKKKADPKCEREKEKKKKKKKPRKYS